jgi:hypothetical protein
MKIQVLSSGFRPNCVAVKLSLEAMEVEVEGCRLGDVLALASGIFAPVTCRNSDCPLAFLLTRDLYC